MTKKSKLIIAIAAILLAVSIRYIMIFVEYNNVSSKKENNELNGEITFVSNRTDKKDNLEKLIDEFEKENPKVKVKLELIGDAEEILARKASVGELSDITLIPASISETQFNKYFLPIDDLGFNEDNIYNYYFGTGTDKKLYGLTTSLSYVGVIYNKKIFEKCNIDKIPTTNKEFYEDCQKIKKCGIVPVVINYKQSWCMDMWLETVPYLFNNKFERNVIDNKYGMFDENSELYKSMSIPKTIYDEGFCQDDINNYDWSECKDDMVSGKVSMMVWNSDFVNQLADLGMDKDNLGVFPIPETSQININGDYRLAISKNTKKPDEAKAFLKFLFENDRYADAVNIMSTLKDSEKSKEFLEKIKKFNCKINFLGDISNNESSEDKKKHYKFIELKHDLSVDYTFMQKYITSTNSKEFLKQYKDQEEKINKANSNSNSNSNCNS